MKNRDEWRTQSRGSSMLEHKRSQVFEAPDLIRDYDGAAGRICDRKRLPQVECGNRSDVTPRNVGCIAMRTQTPNSFSADSNGVRKGAEIFLKEAYCAEQSQKSKE